MAGFSGLNALGGGSGVTSATPVASVNNPTERNILLQWMFDTIDAEWRDFGRWAEEHWGND